VNKLNSWHLPHTLVLQRPSDGAHFQHLLDKFPLNFCVF
jgi:hypothetical protein